MPHQIWAENRYEISLTRLQEVKKACAKYCLTKNYEICRSILFGKQGLTLIILLLCLIIIILQSIQSLHTNNNLTLKTSFFQVYFQSQLLFKFIVVANNYLLTFKIQMYIICKPNKRQLLELLSFRKTVCYVMIGSGMV